MRKLLDKLGREFLIIQGFLRPKRSQANVKESLPNLPLQEQKRLGLQALKYTREKENYYQKCLLKRKIFRRQKYGLALAWSLWLTGVVLGFLGHFIVGVGLIYIALAPCLWVVYLSIIDEAYPVKPYKLSFESNWETLDLDCIQYCLFSDRLLFSQQAHPEDGDKITQIEAYGKKLKEEYQRVWNQKLGQARVTLKLPIDKSRGLDLFMGYS
jgi:hypothetical protein